MIECNATSVDFTPLGRRQVVADFLGGRLTTDAGARLLREVRRVLMKAERMSAGPNTRFVVTNLSGLAVHQ